MTLLKTFWTPIIVYPDVKTGCKFVAAYTIVSYKFFIFYRILHILFYFKAMSIFLIALIIHMQNGGETTQMYNPFFETNLRGKLFRKEKIICSYTSILYLFQCSNTYLINKYQNKLYI